MTDVIENANHKLQKPKKKKKKDVTDNVGASSDAYLSRNQTCDLVVTGWTRYSSA